MEVLVSRFPGLRGFPHVDLGVRPTPVEEQVIDGLAVLVKRDDLTSPVYGGNKVRSLEFLLARPARRLLTYSTLEAHHAYATAVHGARLGLATTAILVRRGRRGALLERLRREAGRVVEVGGIAGAAAATAALWRPGTRVIPPGGMSARGALGYVAAVYEIEEIPARIYATLGSGTTVSGLLAGLALRGARTEVVAVRVADAVAARPCILRGRARRALRLLRRFDPSMPAADATGVRLRIVTAEGGYGEETASGRAAMAAAPGLPLDRTYTAKTLAVLLAERAAGALFLHTHAPPVTASAPSPSS